MTYTIEPMDFVKWYFYTGYPEAVYIVVELALKNGKKFEVETKKQIVEYIWKVLPNDIKLYECKVSLGRFHLFFKPTYISVITELLFQHKIINDLTLDNCKKVYEKEWREYEENFKSHIIKNIINQ
jgi:hypothetical protein